MMSPTIAVSAAEVEFFRREGYLAVTRSLSTPEELAAVRAIYDRLFEEMAGWDEGNAFDLAGTDGEGPANLPQILGPSRYAPALRETLYYANASAIARQLLGPECQAGGDHAILKPAMRGAETPWHQDEAYWNPALEYDALSVWIPLQEATPENGCMQFVPRTQTLAVLPHHTLHHDPRIHALEVDDFEEFEAWRERVVVCPLPPGGATFHASRTLHYTGPNRSALPRRAHVLGFGTPTRPWSGPPREFPWNAMKRTAREARRRQHQAES